MSGLRSSSMMVTIAIEFPTRIVKASSPSRATLSSTTRSVKSIQAIGPGGFTVIDALAPKSVSVIKSMYVYVGTICSKRMHVSGDCK